MDLFCQVYRVTDDALIAETSVWPNFFFMDIFFALKGSKHFIIICQKVTVFWTIFLLDLALSFIGKM